MIMAATLKAVAAVANFIINLEKECCLLNAIRFAKNVASCIEVGKDKCKLRVDFTVPLQTLLKQVWRVWLHVKEMN